MNTTYEYFQDRGSHNHSYLQSRLTKLLDTDKYTTFVELSLELSHLDLSQFDIEAREEVKPDVCIYPKRRLSRPNDILKMSEMPLLAIEIISPKQGIYGIIEKFRVYFALGIKSCWLVEPTIETVTVYSAIDQRKTFVNGEVIDETLNIRLPVQDIFS
ncbi:MAG: hypothetical protein BWK79_10790 [Beggiatoa sp. IS2]|nr:MAG: hypothetical protein BWK79_10790 [Beggiatoa sp. IS2]